MTLPQHESTPLIETLNEEQSQLFAKIGESIVRVSIGVENIHNTERLIARDSAFLYQYKNEAIQPEEEKLFVVKFTEPQEHTFYSPYFMDNGCRSGWGNHSYILEIEPSQEKPTLFLASSVYAYAYDYHSQLLNGYQFNGIADIQLTLNPNLKTGLVDGVEIGQVDYWSAEKLLSGEAEMAFVDDEQLEAQRSAVQKLIASQESQMSLKIEK